MKYFFLFCCLLGAAASRAQAPTAGAAPLAEAPPGIQALDAKNGFRGYTLGAPIANYPDLKRRGPDMYEARKEPLQLGAARLSMLLLEAEGGQLTSIHLVALGKANATKLLAAVRAAYGEGVPDERGRMRWRGAKVGMVYEYTVTHSGGGTIQDITGSVTMYSLELAQATKKALGEP